MDLAEPDGRADVEVAEVQRPERAISVLLQGTLRVRDEERLILEGRLVLDRPGEERGRAADGLAEPLREEARVVRLTHPPSRAVLLNSVRGSHLGVGSPHEVPGGDGVHHLDPALAALQFGDDLFGRHRRNGDQQFAHFDPPLHVTWRSLLITFYYNLSSTVPGFSPKTW